MRRSPPIVLLAVALASCVRAPAPVTPPAASVPVPNPASPQPAAADWRDWPAAPGAWRYGRDPSGTVATFGPDGRDWRMRIACNASTRQIALSLWGRGEASAALRTSSAARTLPLNVVAHADGWPPETSDARLDARDPLLDAIAFSRGRFAVERGAERLAIPVQAEIGRVIEDCRG